MQGAAVLDASTGARLSAWVLTGRAHNKLRAALAVKDNEDITQAGRWETDDALEERREEQLRLQLNK